MSDDGYMDAAAVPVPVAGDDTTVHTVQLDLCELCIRGEGGECHTPGCTMFINRAPDLPLDNHPSFQIVPPDAGDDTLREQLAEALMDARDKRDDQQRRTCTNGCGCRYMTEDPDQRDCACDGQCCTDPDWWDGRDYDEVLADALLPLIREHTAKAELRADARARVEEIKQRSRAEKAEAEVERLTDWKESATTVMSGLQDLGKELGLPLGESITGTLAAETAHRLRTHAETAEAAIERARPLADVSDWRVYESRDTGDVYPAQSVQDLMADVRAALDGGETP